MAFLVANVDVAVVEVLFTAGTMIARTTVHHLICLSVIKTT